MALEVEIAPMPEGVPWVFVPGVVGFYGGWIDTAVAAS